MPLSSEDVVATLNAFVRKQFDIAMDDANFGPNVHLFDNGYVDSFGAQDLITFVESEYGLKISDADLVKYPMNTLSEIASFVCTKSGHATA